MKISPISPNPAPKKEKYPKKAIYIGLLKTGAGFGLIGLINNRKFNKLDNNYNLYKNKLSSMSSGSIASFWTDFQPINTCRIFTCFPSIYGRYSSL